MITTMILPTLRSLILGVAFLSASVVVSQAQSAGGTTAGKPKFDKAAMKERMQAKMASVAKELELTDAQKAQAEELKKKYQKKFEELRSNEHLDRRDKWSEGFSLWQDALAEFRTILTADQNAKLDGIIADGKKEHAKRMEKWKQMRESRGGGAPAKE